MLDSPNGATEAIGDLSGPWSPPGPAPRQALAAASARAVGEGVHRAVRRLLKEARSGEQIAMPGCALDHPTIADEVSGAARRGSGINLALDAQDVEGRSRTRRAVIALPKTMAERQVFGAGRRRREGRSCLCKSYGYELSRASRSRGRTSAGTARDPPMRRYSNCARRWSSVLKTGLRLAPRVKKWQRAWD